MTDTKIEWADRVWNPTTGCDRVSPGCDHCYALTQAPRLQAMERARGDAHPKYQRDGDPRTSGPGFGLSVHPHVLTAPFRWRKPARVFVNSMSDLFHADVPDEFIARVFAVTALSPQHTFQVLTKRHGRMRSLLRADEFREAVMTAAADLVLTGKARQYPVGWAEGPWPLPNVHLGVSVEDQRRAELRVPALLDTPAAVRFLSVEPMLGPVDLDRWLYGDCTCATSTEPRWLPSGGKQHAPDCASFDARPDCGMGWVIAGGESGPGARPMHPSWPRALRDQCVDAGVPFHYKQWGAWRPIEPDETRFRRASDWLVRRDGYHWPLSEPHGAEDGTEATVRRVGKRAAGRDLDGRTWDEAPRA